MVEGERIAATTMSQFTVCVADAMTYDKVKPADIESFRGQLMIAIKAGIAVG